MVRQSWTIIGVPFPSRAIKAATAGCKTGRLFQRQHEVAQQFRARAQAREIDPFRNRMGAAADRAKAIEHGGMRRDQIGIAAAPPDLAFERARSLLRSAPSMLTKSRLRNRERQEPDDASMNVQAMQWRACLRAFHATAKKEACKAIMGMH